MPQVGNYDAEVNNSISRYDFAQIIALARTQAVIRPVRLVYDSGATGYQAGQVLARYTSGANSGLFAKYSNGGSSGLGTAVCVLLVDVSPASGDTVAAPAAFRGNLYYTKLVGLDSGAVTNMGGRDFTDASGTRIFVF